jgi:hypothetical protein
MKQDKSKSPVNYWLIAGAVISFQSGTMKASGPYTSGFKILTAVGGVACCLVGWKQIAAASSNNDGGKK